MLKQIVTATARAAVSGTAAFAQDNETLRVGMSGGYFPFTFVKQDVLQGFEVDVMNAVGEEAGFEVEFETMAFSGLIGALDAGRIDTIANVALPSPTTASYVRIQRDGYGSIALAEVEVYAEPLNLMSSYKAGNPVAASTVMEPYQPAHTFSHKFNKVPYDGRWMVVFDLPGDYVPPRDHKGYGFSAGTLAEVALVVTDLAGVVHTYYQDLKAL